MTPNAAKTQDTRSGWVFLRDFVVLIAVIAVTLAVAAALANQGGN